jgi:hypothetical protein
MLRRILPLILALLPLAGVRAQTPASGEVLAGDTNDLVGNALYINRAECQGSGPGGDDPLTLNWQAQAESGQTLSNGNEYVVKISTDPQCAQSQTDPFIHTVTLIDDDSLVINGSAGGVSGTGAESGVTDSRLTGRNLASVMNLGACNADERIYICIELMNGGTLVGVARSGGIDVDVNAPPAPEITDVAPQDGALDVFWTSQGGGAVAYQILVRPPDPPSVTDVGDVSRHLVTGLTNNSQYQITMIALDAARNASGESGAFPGIPIPITDFWEGYSAQQGKELGGCSSAGAGSALGILAAMVARRRRRGTR